MFVREIIKYLGKEAIFIPGKARYHLEGMINHCVKSRCRSMSCSAHPTVFWTRIENIKYNGMIEISHQGQQFCSGDKWSFPEKHRRPSVFESISEDTYRWSIHETIRMIFVEEKPYTMTPQYESIISQLESSKPSKVVWGCSTREDVDALFERIIVTFENMRKHGYKTQLELGKYNRDEIQIYLTDDGNLLKGIGGNHRILMAEIIGIERIPFVIHGANIDFVIGLCRKMDIPPHKALKTWIMNNTLIQDH